MKQYIVWLCLVLGLAACGSQEAGSSAAEAGSAPAPSGNWVDADLSATKLPLPLVIKAPKGYTVNDSLSEEVELNTEEVNFSVSALGPLDAKEQTKRYRDETAQTEGFQKFIVDSPEGYIAQVNEAYIPYRTVQVGGKGYEFRVIPLYAVADEAQAKEMYDMMGQAKAK